MERTTKNHLSLVPSSISPQNSARPGTRSDEADEALLLHNLALQFRGKPGLEIGCRRGWSTEIASAGVLLDVIDPILSEQKHLESVQDSLAAAGVLANVRLFAAASPDGIRDLAKLSPVKWNFFVIDGDAAECLEHAASDAMIVFHSLTSPDVEKGLQLLWRNGWNVVVYPTMQMMGVAWRGAVQPVAHQADPSIHWALPLHLAKYPVIGESTEEAAHRLYRGMAWIHQENSRVHDECVSLRAEIEALRLEMAARDASPTPYEKDRSFHPVRIGEKERQIQRLFFEVEKFMDEIGRLSPVLGDVLPDFQSVVSSSLWRMAQPLRRLRASRFGPRINMLMLGLAFRILQSVRQGKHIGGPVSATFNQEQPALFDADYYCEMNPDVAQSGMDPFLHYLNYGAAEGRDPHPLFDTSFYIDQNPHIRGLEINPLVHFLKEGPTAEFDPFTTAPELPDSGICIVTPDIVGPVKNGGIGAACYRFARVLAEAGHFVTILFSGDLTDCQKAHWRNTFARIQIKFVALSDTAPAEKPVYGSSWFYERSWRIFDYLRKAHYSVIHFQDWHANGFWSFKAKRVGLAFENTSLTLMTHSCTKWINEGMEQFSADPMETAKLVWAESYCMEHCDALLSPSRYMIQWIRQQGIRLPDKTLHTPSVWHEKSENAIQSNVHVDNDHLIFFGRLETRKGLHVFCDAIRELKAKGGPLPKKITFLGKYASVRGVDAADYLETFRLELPAIEIQVIHNFDHLQALTYIRDSKGLTVICPIKDNHPMTVVESIQNKLPFVAAATGGILELVNEVVSFEPTVDGLAACLGRRSTIHHEGIQHKYSAHDAEKTWCDLNTELASGSFQTPAMGMEDVPLVSVCIPYFNHSQFLETLVRAIGSQDYAALEVIIVNDGSSSEASDEFRRVSGNSRDPRFRFLSTENQGPGAARNHAVKSSAGDLLLFFDADNLPRNFKFVSTLVRAIQRSGADCVTVPYDIVGSEKLQVTDRDIIATFRPTGPCLEAGFFENVFGDATMIIKRTTFELIGGFSTKRAAWEDHEFLLDLCFSGFKLETLPVSAFFYRQSPTGRNQSANEFQNYKSLFERLQSAKSEDLARIIAAVSGPMLLARQGTADNKLLGRW